MAPINAGTFVEPPENTKVSIFILMLPWKILNVVKHILCQVNWI